jgi:hypothetical protein
MFGSSATADQFGFSAWHFALFGALGQHSKQVKGFLVEGECIEILANRVHHVRGRRKPGPEV